MVARLLIPRDELNGDDGVPYFLVQGKYTTETWDYILKNPGDRISVLSKSVASLGGSIVSGYFSFGDYDVVMVLELPDNVSAGAFSMAAAASTAFKAVKTTPLLSVDEGVAAMQKAGGSDAPAEKKFGE